MVSTSNKIQQNSNKVGFDILLKSEKNLSLHVETCEITHTLPSVSTVGPL